MGIIAQALTDSHEANESLRGKCFFRRDFLRRNVAENKDKYSLKR